MNFLYEFIATSPILATIVSLAGLMLATGIFRFTRVNRTALWLAAEGQFQTASQALIDQARQDAQLQGIAQRFDLALNAVEQYYPRITIGHVVWAMDVARQKLALSFPPPAFQRPCRSVRKEGP